MLEGNLFFIARIAGVPQRVSPIPVVLIISMLFNVNLVTILNVMKINNTILLTTEKDYFRISENYKKNISFIKIKIEIENKNQFIGEIKKII